MEASSDIQVKNSQNVNCTLKIVGKYYIRCVLWRDKAQRSGGPGLHLQIQVCAITTFCF